MREVLSIHIGQAGVQLGTNIWELYCIEHGLDAAGRASTLTGGGEDFNKPSSPDRTSRMTFDHGDVREASYTSHVAPGPIGSDVGSFFTESKSGVYSPRALFVDLEPSVIDEVRNGKYKNFFPSNRLISDAEDAANNYARGYHTCGQRVISRVMNAVKAMAEASERLQGFMIFHSFGGGTGSGFHSLLCEEIDSQFNKMSTLEIAVFPSPALSTAVVEPYNAVLATNATLGLRECVFLADNEAMYEICQKSLDIDRPTYRNLNRLLAQTVSSVTASLRFKGSLNADFSDFQTNLVPFPRIHYPILSYAPISSKNSSTHESLSISEMTSLAFESTNRMVRCDTDGGKYISCCLLYRGDIAPKDVNQAIAHVKTKKQVQFVPWSPTGFKVGINQQPPTTFPNADIAITDKAVCMIANNTAIKDAWANLNTKYNLMLEKKAFFHWYTNEGMPEQEFYDAQENVLMLEEEYEDMLSPAFC
uniref:Tubulin alpha chain n=1 Tax=Lygus hesperus TaxID=30085 RepID=A0A0A9W615_LYGHE